MKLRRMKLWLLTLFLQTTIALPLAAAPQWPTLEPFLPEQSGALVVVHVDKDAREALASSLPVDPAIVQKVLDEQFGAFAQASGIKVLELSNVFGGFSFAGGKSAPGVVGFAVPLELAKVVKTLKATVKPEQIKETPDSVIFSRGPLGWAFLKEGLILTGKADQLEAILKRKGGSPTNTAFVTAAKARGSAATNLFLMATLPAGMLPPLPDNAVIAKLGIDRKLTTHLTGVIVTSNEAGLTMNAEFDDAAAAKALVDAYGATLKVWQQKLAADLAAAQQKADAMGALGHIHPELVSGRMGVEFADFVIKAVAVKTDGKLAVMTVPRELLRAFKGSGTIMTLGIAAAVAAPALKAAQQGGLQTPDR